VAFVQLPPGSSASADRWSPVPATADHHRSECGWRLGAADRRGPTAPFGLEIGRLQLAGLLLVGPQDRQQADQNRQYQQLGPRMGWRYPDAAMVRDAIKRVLPLGLRKAIKLGRVRLFETFGSKRYSYPALNGLDRKMMPYLPELGVFLEIGANDGYTESNTYYLERFCGWEGILIEPVPYLFQRCQSLRKQAKCYGVACLKEPGTARMTHQDLMSVVLGQQDHAEEVRRLDRGGKIRGSIDVPGVTISSVIDQSGYSQVDFMSIDVEGKELSVLGGLDFQRHCPTWLLIETRHPEEITAALQAQMAFEAKLSHHDYLFRRK
jgi:FkbM family methyltransferase